MAGEERVTKLKIDNVKKIYQTRKGEMTALNGVNLDIKENEFICVVGPSGCGKSTLLNIIAGLDTPTSGAVYTLTAKRSREQVQREALYSSSMHCSHG